MFSSIYSKRWFKWITGNKRYIVNIEVSYENDYLFASVEVEARSKLKARRTAIEKVQSELQFKTIGTKSFGRVRRFEEC